MLSLSYMWFVLTQNLCLNVKGGEPGRLWSHDDAYSVHRTEVSTYPSVYKTSWGAQHNKQEAKEEDYIAGHMAGHMAPQLTEPNTPYDVSPEMKVKYMYDGHCKCHKCLHMIKDTQALPLWHLNINFV